MQAQQVLNNELSAELERERELRQSLEAAARRVEPAASGGQPRSTVPPAHPEVVEGEWCVTPSVGTWLRPKPQDTRAVEPSVASTPPAQLPAVVEAAAPAHRVLLVSPVEEDVFVVQPSVGTWYRHLPSGALEAQALATAQAREAQLKAELASERQLRTSLEAPELRQVEEEVAAQRRLRENLQQSTAQLLKETETGKMKHATVLQKCKEATIVQDERNVKMAAELTELRASIEKKKRTSGCSVQ